MNPEDEGDVAASQTDGTKTDPPSETMFTIEDPTPISSGPKSYIDLINECDNFPYYQTNPKLFFAHIHTYYGLYIADYPETELGYILPSVAEVFRGLPDWKIDDKDRSLTLISGSTEEERSIVVAMTCKALRATNHFKVLKGWRNELYPVYGPNRELLFSIERSACPLFGVVTYGCHMTAYTRSLRQALADEKAEADELKIWVPRRAITKQTYGGMLDNSVAGGIATGEVIFDSMVRECAEEASLAEDLVRSRAKAVGAITYFHIRDERAGECEYVYDLELPEDVVPKPSDDEVEGFELMTVEEVKEHLRRGEYKPNCALVLIDFFIRHGIIPAEEEGYVEMVARLHRRFEFPTI
ncbi:hypothetical protein LTR78_002282 [Recurvomyces mirabilis]|uniref:Nudix hydrolase domain-containing protein n=1 Tax=Recurvomyces mirabilis TaxID=574656 RepID=A0AAE0WUJ8_9PEZI|nr:hypothetical protein LTR78_002282 [Recurvomyces mirabilis]KAK5160737.1 hypothetical protein LTS14_001750 [Recurvomyces mirabilis]